MVVSLCDLLKHSKLYLGYSTIYPLKRIVPSLKNVSIPHTTMPNLDPAIIGADPTPDVNANAELTDPAIDPAADAATVDPDDTGTDPGADTGIHPDALDPTDPNPIEDLTDEDIKDTSRLQTRFKDLTTKANRASDLETQNDALLAEIATLKKGGDPEPEDPKAPEGYTPAQIEEAKKLMDNLGYVPKEEVELLKTDVQKLTNQQASREDSRMMNDAMDNYKDGEGNHIVTERHINNALRTWLKSDNSQVRKRVQMDYDGIIQLIGGSKLQSKTVKKKKTLPKVASTTSDPAYTPDTEDIASYDPGNPIGSEQSMLARILKNIG